jgi:tetratricopeptide (TPR) repeat protein
MDAETTPYSTPGPTLAVSRLKKVALVVVGLVFGTSAFLSGFYDTTVWEPILLGCLSLLVALAVARPAVPIGSAAVAIGGLLALWLWSLLSGSWTEAVDLAVTDANRWLLYGIVLALLLYLANDAESRRWLLGATTAGVLIVAGYVMLRFLAGEGADLFVVNRLDGPLGYINGVASYMLVGIWPLVALAERARHPLVRGASVFAAVQLISVAILTQSRGAVLALIASTALILIVVPGRLTRAWSLLVILGGAAVSIPALRDVISSGVTAPTEDALRSIAEASLAGGLVAGLIWALACFATTAVARRSDSNARTMRRVSIAGITAIALIGIGVVFAHPGQRVDQVQNQYDTFTSLQPADGGSRLASGGGNRYDYWRVAVNQLQAHPLNGVGAGNYTSTYYQERKTSEDIQQAHSIELQTLGELGLIGGLALVAFVGAVLFGFWRTARGSPFHRANPTIAVAAGGTFLVWFFQTSVDWMHLVPGLTGIALCAAAALLPAARPLNRRTPIVAIVIVAVVAGLAAYPVANQLLALRLKAKASDKLRTDPIGALEDAQGSLSLQPAQRTYYIKSAAFAQLGLYEPARDALLAATRRVPHDFVAWGLLGDLAIKRGLEDVAKRNYQRAEELNPRDPGHAVQAEGEDDQPQP